MRCCLTALATAQSEKLAGHYFFAALALAHRALAAMGIFFLVAALILRLFRGTLTIGFSAAAVPGTRPGFFCRASILSLIPAGFVEGVQESLGLVSIFGVQAFLLIRERVERIKDPVSSREKVVTLFHSSFS
jgi:hypothetical protein